MDILGWYDAIKDLETVPKRMGFSCQGIGIISYYLLLDLVAEMTYCNLGLILPMMCSVSVF